MSAAASNMVRKTLENLERDGDAELPPFINSKTLSKLILWVLGGVSGFFVLVAIVLTCARKYVNREDEKKKILRRANGKTAPVQVSQPYHRWG